MQSRGKIEMFNKILHKYNIDIFYKSRTKDTNNHWILNDVYIPVYPVEIKRM